jgi:hypothetical protein
MHWKFGIELLEYAFYMQWRRFEMLPLCVALKLGFQPLTNALLVATVAHTSPPPKPSPILS